MTGNNTSNIPILVCSVQTLLLSCKEYSISGKTITACLRRVIKNSIN